MLSVILVALFCTIYGYNLRAEFVYIALFAVSFPLWITFSPLAAVAFLTVQTLAVWFVVEFFIRQTPVGFGLFWQLGGLRLAIARV